AQATLGIATELDPECGRRVIESTRGEIVEIPPRPAHRLHERREPRVFELLRAPRARQLGTPAGRELFGSDRNGMHVEQRAVGIEDEGGRWLDRHWITSSARASTAGGTVIPSARAVRK